MRVPLVVLTLLAGACGDPDVVTRAAPPGCEDLLAACEYHAARVAPSVIVHWFELRACSADFGACIQDCALCGVTYVPSACRDECTGSL